MDAMRACKMLMACELRRPRHSLSIQMAASFDAPFVYSTSGNGVLIARDLVVRLVDVASSCPPSDRGAPGSESATSCAKRMPEIYVIGNASASATPETGSIARVGKVVFIRLEDARQLEDVVRFWTADRVLCSALGVIVGIQVSEHEFKALSQTWGTWTSRPYMFLPPAVGDILRVRLLPWSAATKNALKDEIYSDTLWGSLISEVDDSE
jgi:hypothetical protein